MKYLIIIIFIFSSNVKSEEECFQYLFQGNLYDSQDGLIDFHINQWNETRCSTIYYCAEFYVDVSYTPDVFSYVFYREGGSVSNTFNIPKVQIDCPTAPPCDDFNYDPTQDYPPEFFCDSEGNSSPDEFCTTPASDGGAPFEHPIPRCEPPDPEPEPEPQCQDEEGFCTTSGFCTGAFGLETANAGQCVNTDPIPDPEIPENPDPTPGSDEMSNEDPDPDDPDNPDTTPDPNPIPDPDGDGDPIPDPDGDGDPIPDPDGQKSHCELEPDSPLCNDFGGTLGTSTKGEFDSSAQILLNTTKSEYVSLITRISGEISTLLSFDLTSNSAGQLPVIDVGTIKGVDVKYDLQRFTPQLINLGNIFIFIAYLSAFTIILGKK